MNKFCTFIGAAAILGCSNISQAKGGEVISYHDPEILKVLENTQKSCDGVLTWILDIGSGNENFYYNGRSYNYVELNSPELLKSENNRLVNYTEANLDDKNGLKERINVCISELNNVILSKNNSGVEKNSISKLISDLKLIINELPEQMDILNLRLNNKIDNLESRLSEVEDDFILKHYIIYSLILIIITVVIANDLTVSTRNSLRFSIKKLEGMNKNNIKIFSKINDVLNNDDKTNALLEIEELLKKIKSESVE